MCKDSHGEVAVGAHPGRDDSVGGGRVWGKAASLFCEDVGCGFFWEARNGHNDVCGDVKGVKIVVFEEVVVLVAKFGVSRI